MFKKGDTVYSPKHKVIWKLLDNPKENIALVECISIFDRSSIGLGRSWWRVGQTEFLSLDQVKIYIPFIGYYK